METKYTPAVALTDEDYDRIVDLVRKAGRRGTTLTNTTGVTMRFYYKGNDRKQLWGDTRTKEGNVTTTEVFRQSDVMHGNQINPFKESVKQKMKQDHPDWSEEELDFNADLCSEANDSIKRLIQSGIDPNTAYNAIMATLEGKKLTETEEKET
jgi:hypothetical protein